MNVNIVSFIVRGLNGINMEATLTKFAEAVAAWDAASAERNARIRTVVHALFDKWHGHRLSSGFIQSEVLPVLGSTPATWGEDEKAVIAYLASDPTLHTRVGRGGGTARIADMTPEERAKIG